jgi:type VI secretion system protein ImpF
MAPANRSVLVTSSVLDRLLDDDPRSPRAPAGAGAPDGRADLAQHKQSVARDLEALLNARCVAVDVRLLEGFPQARNSFLSYGITDLSSLSLLNPDHRMLLRDQIRATIERHEPRLAQVRVNLDVPREASRMLRFRVEALLEVHPHRPPVAFDAMLKLSSSACQVRSQD